MSLFEGSTRTDSSSQSALFRAHENGVRVADNTFRMNEFETVTGQEGVQDQEEFVHIEVGSRTASGPIAEGNPVYGVLSGPDRCPHCLSFSRQGHRFLNVR